MSQFDQAKELLIESLSRLDEIDDKEKYLNRVLTANVFNETQLLTIKNLPQISRHLSLVHRIEKHLENKEFSKRNDGSSKESPLVILAGLLIGPL